MKCRYPILQKDKYGVLVYVPCGQCRFCRINHARQWSKRIVDESRLYKDRCCFLTLTYDDEHMTENGSLVKKDFQDFMKRFRESVGSPVRYFMCGEYGEQLMPDKDYGRPHFHICLFGVSVDSDIFKERKIAYKRNRFGVYKPNGFHVKLASWTNGLCHVGTLTKDSANYVAGYVIKKSIVPKPKEWFDERHIIPEFVLMSRRPGIGARYIERAYVRQFLQHNKYVLLGSSKYSVPRYYKDKLGLKRSGNYRDFMDSCRSVYDNPEEQIQAYKNLNAKLHILGKDKRL